ncbi:hypothetical protein FGG08_001922 [Glutinoglossum americanum]|uniref:Vacuolar ATPase assembly protein VMA22 n=1 Tax=Glutinoglossum americanum TaxID=1670608 RepID=A0A9P8I122_9PEZI|nr:hypothetical protein FGG08_001922 [Glutinoglossum americanum]
MSKNKSPRGVPIRNNEIIQSNISEHLNQLLEQYLALLDQYQSLRTELTKSLSSGYISLAEANFLSTGRVKYGQDFYDERMQATKRLNSPLGEDDLIPSFELVQPTPGTPGSESKTNLVTHESSATTGKRVPNDPLRWFGILVPPALRNTQREFTDAVNIVPKLVEVIAQMDLCEKRIKEARKDVPPKFHFKSKDGGLSEHQTTAPSAQENQQPRSSMVFRRLHSLRIRISWIILELVGYEHIVSQPQPSVGPSPQGETENRKR